MKLIYNTNNEYKFWMKFDLFYLSLIRIDCVDVGVSSKSNWSDGIFFRFPQKLRRQINRQILNQ